MNEIIVKWNQIYTKDITLSTSTKINTLLVAESQVIRANSEDNLQRVVFTLQNTEKNLGMEMSPEKSEMMAFVGEDSVRCKIVVDSKWLLTPWSRVLLEKLTSVQLVKKFSEFYGTRRFITAVTSVHHLSLSWASLIQSIPHILLPEDTS